MIPRILITDGGPHVPEAWAAATADMIFTIDDKIAPARRVKAMKLQAQFAEILAGHHGIAQEQERTNLGNRGPDRMMEDIGAMHVMDGVLADLRAAVSASPFAEQFDAPGVWDQIAALIHDHFVSSQHVERLWHADRNPDCAVSQEYRARFHGGTEG